MRGFGCPLAVCPPKRPRPFAHYRTFLLKLFGHLRDIPAKILGSPAQRFGFPAFRGTYRTFFAPTPSHGRHPPHRKISGPKSLGLCSFSCLIFPGASFFGIEMSFLWYRGGLSLWYRDLFLGIEILHSVVHHLDRLLPGMNPCMLFWASISCKLEVKKISTLKRRKNDISIPTKRVTRFFLQDILQDILQDNEW